MSSLLILPLNVRGHTGQLTKNLGTMNFGSDAAQMPSSFVLIGEGRSLREPGVNACSLEEYSAADKHTYAHKKSC
jgi:hypothetical protein